MSDSQEKTFGELLSEGIGKMKTDLAAALAANQRLENERDEARRDAKDYLAYCKQLTASEKEQSEMAIKHGYDGPDDGDPFHFIYELLNLRTSEVASLTAERDDLIQYFDIKQGTLSDAMKRLDVQNRNTAAERDRLICRRGGTPQGAGASTRQPSLVEAVGHAREALKKDFDRFTALGRGGWAIDCAEALALLTPFALKVDQSTESAS